MCLTSYWFSFKPIINAFSFINNYTPHQQFINFFVKKICISSITKNKLTQKNNKKKVQRENSSALSLSLSMGPLQTFHVSMFKFRP